MMLQKTFTSGASSMSVVLLEPGIGEAAFSTAESEASWTQAARELDEIRKLENDWDGLGAVAPRQDLIETAEVLLSLLKARDFAAPSSIVSAQDGTVSLSWQSGNDYLNAEVVSPGVVEWMLVTPGRPTEYWNWSSDSTPSENPVGSMELLVAGPKLYRGIPERLLDPDQVPLTATFSQL